MLPLTVKKQCYNVSKPAIDNFNMTCGNVRRKSTTTFHKKQKASSIIRKRNYLIIILGSFDLAVIYDHRFHISSFLESPHKHRFSRP